MDFDKVDNSKHWLFAKVYTDKVNRSKQFQELLQPVLSRWPEYITYLVMNFVFAALYLHIS